MDIPEKFRKKLDELTVSDYCGLNSPGLTCYLNSVLQVLFMTEDFCEAVEGCCNKKATVLDQHLHRLFTDLRTREAQTHNIINTLGITDIYEQRDAAEYFEKILCLTSLDAAKMFRGELNYATTCVSCKETIDCCNFFWTLPLVVEHSTKGSRVDKGLKAFFAGQKMCGDNQMFCSRCNKKQDAMCRCEMTKPPKILTLLMMRFSFDSKCGSYIKLHTDVIAPQTLHVNSRAYDLYATVNHYGTLKCGHYVAQIKSYENQVWYQFDDNIVKKMESKLFKDGATCLSCSTAYLLMYRTGNKHAGSAGFRKNTYLNLQASFIQGKPQRAVVGEKKHESFNREENCRVWETAEKLAEHGNQPQYKVTADGRKSHTAPQCDCLQEPRGVRCYGNQQCPLRAILAGEEAQQSSVQQQDERCSSPAKSKTRRRLNNL